VCIVNGQPSQGVELLIWLPSQLQAGMNREFLDAFSRFFFGLTHYWKTDEFFYSFWSGYSNLLRAI